MTIGEIPQDPNDTPESIRPLVGALMMASRCADDVLTSNDVSDSDTLLAMAFIFNAFASMFVLDDTPLSKEHQNTIVEEFRQVLSAHSDIAETERDDAETRQ